MKKNTTRTTILTGIVGSITTVITTKVLGVDLLGFVVVSTLITAGITLAVGIAVVMGWLFIITKSASKPHELQGSGYYAPNPQWVKSDEYLSELRSEVAKRRALCKELASCLHSHPQEGSDVDVFRNVRSTVGIRLEKAKRELADAEATLVIREAEIKTRKADWIGIGYNGSVIFWENKSKEGTSTHANPN